MTSSVDGMFQIGDDQSMQHQRFKCQWPLDSLRLLCSDVEQLKSPQQSFLLRMKPHPHPILLYIPEPKKFGFSLLITRIQWSKKVRQAFCPQCPQKGQNYSCFESIRIWCHHSVAKEWTTRLETGFRFFGTFRSMSYEGTYLDQN